MTFYIYYSHMQKVKVFRMPQKGER